MNCKAVVNQFYNAALAGQSVQDQLATDAVWCASHPINDLTGADAVVGQYFDVLRSAMPDIERKVFIEIASEHDGEQWVCSHGYLYGTFAKPLFSIPAHGKTLYVRFSEMTRVSDGKVAENYVITDFLDVMVQAGVNPLRKSLGFDGLIMPPTTMDGLAQDDQDGTEGAISIQLIKDMLGELGRYDGKSLESMNLGKYWTQDFMWYGPAGIGTTRGIEGFRKHHQGPFLAGYPDRSVDTSVAFVGEGNYACTGGWPHMSMTHTGAAWLGLPPTNKELLVRVMDFWRREDDLLKENWVSIDVIHMVKQMGLDLFEVVAQQQAGHTAA